MKPEVSVIIPVHNAERYLVQCLDSVRAQTFADFEVICVDDGSEDGSLALLREYARSDERFTVIAGTFGGPSSTRNAALAEARGSYIAFLDADDWWDERLLEKAVSCAKRLDAQIVVFDYWLYREGQELSTYRDQRFFARLDRQVVNVASRPELVGFVGVWDRLFRRDALVPHGFMNGLLYEDAVYCIEAVLRATRVAIMADHLYYYRRGVAHSITYDEDASRKHEEDFLAAQGYIQDCLRSFGVSREAWACYARYFNEYAYMHQREVVPYGRFKAYFEEVRAQAFPSAGVRLFDLVEDDQNPHRSAYRELVRRGDYRAAWAQARALAFARWLLRWARQRSCRNCWCKRTSDPRPI